MLQKISCILLVTGSSISIAHALDEAPAGIATSKQDMVLIVEKSAPTATLINAATLVKMPEQMVTKPVQARRDGSDIVLPEAYPESFFYQPPK